MQLTTRGLVLHRVVPMLFLQKPRAVLASLLLLLRPVVRRLVDLILPTILVLPTYQADFMAESGKTSLRPSD